jgi:hypothetical protein
MALSGSIKVLANFAQTKTGDLDTASSTIAASLATAFSDGVTAGSADRLFRDTRTLAASATEDLDLSGSLTNIYGDTVVFADVRAILVLAAAANTNNVNVTRPASNGLPLFLAASDGIAVRPGGAFLWICPDATGVAVTAGTGDLLTFTNSAGSTSVDYTVLILGASA